MAVKKKETNKPDSGPAPARKAATRKGDAIQAPPAQQPTPEGLAVASGTAPKAGTPKSPTSATGKSPAKPATPKAAAAPIKLTERQLEFLKMIHGTKEPGFLLGRKADQRTLDALLDRKLIKKGAKDRDSGSYRYSVSKAGEKHLSSSPPSA